MKKIGFIGMGNMAKALVRGFLASGKVRAEELLAYAPNQKKLQANAEELGFKPCENVQALACESDVVIMACKPYQVEGVLREIKELLAGKVLLSVANNWDFDTYRPLVHPTSRVQYIMPNTPCQVGEGVFLLEEKNSLTEEEQTWLRTLLSACGTVIDLPASLMAPGSAVAGCGPAFVSVMMEAMADAAVKHGIPRQAAYKMVAQMVIGTGKLLLETGQHPGQLKDAVCSPGGTTICGVMALEHAGMRAAFMDAVDAAAGK
jgi:pyrroline-5-carboxylate reductase